MITSGRFVITFYLSWMRWRSFDRLIPNYRGPLVVPMLRTSDRDTPKPRPTARMAVLLRRRQSGSFPRFEAAGDVADVFVDCCQVVAHSAFTCGYLRIKSSAVINVSLSILAVATSTRSA